MDGGGNPREIAMGVMLLTSDETNDVTGVELIIDGGDLTQ